LLPKHSTFGHARLADWTLDPKILYLNHGTVGAPPRRVLAAQQKLRDEIELQPSRFLLRELTETPIGATRVTRPRLRAAADKVGQFLGAEGKDIVFVDNVTSGINAVLRTYNFRQNDEVLILEYAYGAVLNAAKYATRSSGATVRVAEVPDRIEDPNQVIEIVKAAIGPKTRMLVVDHITADTALVLPLAEIAAICRQRGVDILADGAHAPGAIALNIGALGVDWYSGNLHKWAWSPRSSGVLWTDPARQADLHETIISWGLDLGMTKEFDWPGTRDPTPHLTAPAAIEYMREIGLPEIQSYNHELAWNAVREMAVHWKTFTKGPESMIGTMATVPLPERFGSTIENAMRLRDALLFEDNIEVHVYAGKGRVCVRISAQIYNELSDVERLITAIDGR
jgi:isopenicillin-N epimerase